MFHDVCDVLKRAGFRTHPGDGGLAVAPLPDGVLIEWAPDPALLQPVRRLTQGDDSAVADPRYGDGIKQAMTTAVAAVLEQAGFQVRPVAAGLAVTAPAATPPAPPASPKPHSLYSHALPDLLAEPNHASGHA
jgi:hypothetical protein